MARDIAKTKEAEFSAAQTAEIWKSTAQSFAEKVEPLLKMSSNLFTDCDGAGNTLKGIILSGQGQPSHTPGPRKDF